MELKDLTLEILSQESEKILKTLPVAHYLKVDTIPVIFDNHSETSYFNPYGFEIHIALKNIAEAIIGSGKTELSNADLEKHIRCFLYHEISHAILTPRNLMARAQSGFTLLNPNFANILEDERIETILKHYYHGVDFKQNLHNVVPLQHSKNFENFVFNAVRFRYSPIMKKQVNQKVNQFIQCTSKINSTTSEESSLCRAMENLLKYLKGIWDKLVEMAKNMQPQNSSSDQEEKDSSSTSEDKSESTSKKDHSQSETEDTTDSADHHSSKEESDDAEDNSSEEESKDTDKDSEESSKEDSGKSDSETEEKGKDSSKEESGDKEEDAEDPSQSEEEDITAIIGDDFKEENSDSELSTEEIEKTMKKAVVLLKQEAAKNWAYSMKLKDFECDNDTKIELLKVIVRNVGTGINQSQAQYGYCGRFNAKRFMKDHNDSCKWFEKKAYEDNQKSKKSSKKILNIWLDQSGSFERNDNEVNKILKALYEIESKRNDFEWNLIRVDSHFVIERNKERRFSKSSGSNALPKEEIEKCYRELNKTGFEYNIVLFDGTVGANIDQYLEQLDNEQNRVMSSTSYDEKTKRTYAQRCQEQRLYLEERRKVMDYKNLKVFDNKHTIFITESSNTKDIRIVCKNAKAIIEENCDYAGTLAKNVIKALDLLF